LISHLTPGIVHSIPQAHDLIEIAHIGGHDEYVGLANETHDFLGYIPQFGFVDVGEGNFQSKSGE
jgi:hypothetical protein